MAAGEFKYRAFISYSHADEAWGKWLHQKLERYRVPSRLVGRQSKFGPVPSKVGRCFRDQTELSAASHLGDTLQQALRDSRCLIVVCSPRSATSNWVNEEIKFFRDLGRDAAVFALIVDGEPNAVDGARECFPSALRDSEPLAANVREQADGKSDGFLKLVAGLLDVGFDELRQRERRRRTRLVAATLAASVVIAASTTVLAIVAYLARNEATERREQADDLIAFMLGDLKNRLDKVGRLDVMDATVSKALDYLDRSTGSNDSSTLARRSRAYANLADIYYSRGHLPEAVTGGSEAIKSAQALRSQQPGDEADELLAAGLLARAVPSLESGITAENERDARNALAIALRLNAEAPTVERALLLANANDTVAFAEANTNTDQALQRWDQCVAALAPFAGPADSRPLAWQLRCRLQHASAIFNVRNSVEEWSPFVAAAKAAAQKFPRDMNLVWILQAGFSSAAAALGRTSRLEQAQEAADLAINLSERMVAHDPENNEWMRWLATAYRGAAKIAMQRSDMDLAQRRADESLAVYERARARDPSSENLRREILALRLNRARIASSQGNRTAAVSEIDAGLAIAREEGLGSISLTNVAQLHLTKWLLGNEPPSKDNPDVAAAADALSRIPVAEAGVTMIVESRAALVYAQGDVAEGDRVAADIYAGNDVEAVQGLGEVRLRSCAHAHCAQLDHKNAARP